MMTIPPAEPYPALTGGAYGRPIPESPDMLASYRWDFASLDAPVSYQVVTDCATSALADPPSSFVNPSALVTGKGEVTVRAAGELVLRFNAEAASWIELDSDDLSDDEASRVFVTISENRLRAPLESASPRRVGGSHTFRLELNTQLYEGVHYAFFNISSRPALPWHIKGVRRVTQTLPVNYGGSFFSSDARLTRLWWVGAYTTRATFVSERDPTTNRSVAYLGSILMNRGDRIAFLGDAHVAQATALAAFTNDTHSLLNSSLQYTSSGSGGGIEPYLLMWVNSVADYFNATGDVEAVRNLAPAIESRLQRARDVVYPRAVEGRASLRWSRDDERLGFGFESPVHYESRNRTTAGSARACPIVLFAQASAA